MKTSHKTKQARIFLVFVVVLISIAITSWYVYQNRCTFGFCAPASWETIQGIAFAKTDDDTRIASMSASSFQWNSSAFESAVVEIDIEYVTKAPNGIGPRIITLDDKTLAIHLNTADIMGIEFPSSESQDILKRVKIHPRAAFAAVLQIIESDQSIETGNVFVFANLIILDNGKAFDGHESVWHVYYADHLTYSVDAQTGEVFSIEKWP